MTDETPQRRNPWIKFYPSDWRADPRLRMCSFAARGLWVDLMTLMHEAEPYGHLIVAGKAPNARQLSSLLGGNVKEIEGLFAELEDAGVFSRTEQGTVLSRRMVRDAVKANRDTTRGNSGGNPNIERGSAPKDQRVRPFKKTDSPAKTLRIWNKSNGNCHWCEIPLDWSGCDVPNVFHVDHVIPVKDGGTNDESNLVASCVICNRHRAGLASESGRQVCERLGLVPVGRAPDSNPDSNHDHNTDSKAQMPDARCQKEESQNQKSEIHSEAASSTIPAPRKNRGPGAAAQTLPADWTPDQANLDLALSMGLTFPEAERAALKFRAYWTTGRGQGTRRKPSGWNTTWANWISKEANHVGQRPAQSAPTRQERNVGHADPDIRKADMLGILEGLGLDRVSGLGPIDPREAGA